MLIILYYRSTIDYYCLLLWVGASAVAAGATAAGVAAVASAAAASAAAAANAPAPATTTYSRPATLLLVHLPPLLLRLAPLLLPLCIIFSDLFFYAFTDYSK